MESDTSILAQEIRNGKAVIASNRSVQQSSHHFPATQGWIPYGTTSKIQIHGHGTVSGGGQPISSKRPEMGGLLGAFTAVDAILSTVRQATNHQGALQPDTPNLHAIINNKAIIQ